MATSDSPKTPKPTEKTLEQQWLPQLDKLLPVVVVLVIISLLSVGAMHALGGTEKLRSLVLQAGSWAPIVFILLKASTYVVAPLSGTPLIITAGALFGMWPAMLYIVVGEVLGATLNFWIARLLGRPGIRRFAGAKAVKRVDDTLEHVGGWRALLLASLLLSSLYDFISYAAGLSKLPFKQFLAVTVVGVVPSALLYVFIGDTLTSGPGAMLMVLGLFLLLGLGWWLRRWLKQPKA